MTQNTTQSQTLQYAREGGVAVVSISNPPMNVCTLAMAHEMAPLLEQIAGDRSIRAVLIRSATPGVFAAGADLTLLNEPSVETLAALRSVVRLLDTLAELPQPTVAALGGTTLGVGFELALACDFRFMADGSGEIGLPEVRLGMTPGAGGTQRLPRIVGAARATEMLMKGMRYTPAQAKELGLVLEVVTPE